MAVISTTVESSSGYGYDFAASVDTLTITASGRLISDKLYGVHAGSAYSDDRIENDGYISGGENGVLLEGRLDSLVNDSNASIYSKVDAVVARGEGDAVTNAANATISGFNGVILQGDGESLRNGSGGTILGTSNAGVYLAGSGDTVANDSGGTISGDPVALILGGAGESLTNSANAIIEGSAKGVVVQSSGSVENDGAITGATIGTEFEIGGAGMLSNTGSITGAIGIMVDGAPGVTITNSGTIDGTSEGIVSQNFTSAYLAPDLAIMNSGKIIGGMEIDSSSATIHNSGTITGELDLLGVSAALRNTGSISGDIDVGGAASAIRNTGAVSGDIAITGAGMVLLNSGTIHGDVGFGSGTNLFDGSGGTIDGSLTGGTGNDTFELGRQIVGGLIDGGAGTDTVRFATASGAVDVDLAAGIAIGPGISDSLVNFENVTGSNYADMLTGTTGNNVLNGGGGADTMTGGLGNDTYYVDNIGDKVIEANNGGNDTVYSSVSFSLSGQFIETLALVGTANINATGNNQANMLIGNAGNNVITTGGGPDIVAYASPVFGADTITDFTAGSASGHDTIQFASSIFANYAAVTAHAAQVGSDVVITYDAHDTIDIQHVTLASLTASDFAFV